MNDMASTRKMGPLVPCGLWEESAGLAAASTGLAVGETEADFGVFFVEGKRRFYQEKSFEFRVSRPDRPLHVCGAEGATTCRRPSGLTTATEQNDANQQAARHSRLAPTLEAIGARFVCRRLRIPARRVLIPSP